ncbi:hypothetical protein WJX72_006114 [[Myrmecia] bisecta]|uniref:MYND-type domain-containing protein n=1 Tax=[Myrmecia] bisecta TaxID=41462 RepID=A0AAW1QR00_9CHLO
MAKAHSPVKEREDADWPEKVSGSVPSVAASSSDGDNTGFARSSDHYDPERDMILRVECMSARELKGVLILSCIFSMACLSLLVVVLVVGAANQSFDPHNRIDLWSTCNASLCWAVLVVCVAWYLVNIRGGRLAHKYWSKRRKRVCFLNLLLLLCMLAHVSFWLASCLYMLAVPCGWFDEVLKWLLYAQRTCWNTLFLALLVAAHNTNLWTRRNGSVIYRARGWPRAIYSSLGDAALRVASRGKYHKHGLILDAPLFVHAPKLALWVLYQTYCTLDLIRAVVDDNIIVRPSANANCRDWTYACSHPAGTWYSWLLSAFNMVALSLYFFYYSLFVSRGIRDSWSRPYHEFRLGNCLVQLQARRVFFGFWMVLALIIVVTCFSKRACPYLLVGWMTLPIDSRLTALVASTSWMFMPKAPSSGDSIMHVWLQKFAWTEAGEATKRMERSHFLQGGHQGPQRAALDAEPLYVVETAIKLMYWAGLAYDIDEVARSKQGRSVDVGMALYGLQEHVTIRSKLSDAKGVIAWSQSMILVSFRGTASMKAAMHDAQAWLTAHPPKRGSVLLQTRPMVHAGFLASWHRGGFREAVLNKLQSLAIPAASLHVTTFGAPRTGNHAFAREYILAIPDTWHIINDRDAVARMGKFACLYKRPGHRVVINKQGDMLVRPSAIEQRIELLEGRSRLGDHYLEAYRAAFAKVIKLQFGEKALPGGSQGVLSLASSAVLQNVLRMADEQVADLVTLDAEEEMSAAVVELLHRSPAPGAPRMNSISCSIPELKFFKHVLDLNSEKLSAQYKEDRRRSWHLGPEAFHISFLVPALPMTPEDTDKVTRKCAACSLPGDKRCARCQEDFYCSKECQSSHWREHKAACKAAQAAAAAAADGSQASASQALRNSYDLQDAGISSTSEDGRNVVIPLINELPIGSSSTTLINLQQPERTRHIRDHSRPPPNVHGSARFLGKIQAPVPDPILDLIPDKQDSLIAYDQARSFQTMIMQNKPEFPVLLSIIRRNVPYHGCKEYCWARRDSPVGLRIFLDVPNECPRW